MLKVYIEKLEKIIKFGDTEISYFNKQYRY